MDEIIKETDEYIMAKCSHCKGEGKCDCTGCRKEAGILEDFSHGYKAKCSSCDGSGKVIFWKNK